MMGSQHHRSEQAPSNSGDFALEGLKVVELATGVAGPYCGKLFADFGADVIKVEPPTGDPSRKIGPFPQGSQDAGALFLWLNANKRGITLDCHVDDSHNTLRKLLAGADVLVDGGPGSALDQLGLDAEEMARLNPRLIVTSLSAFGQAGLWRDRPATDLTVSALGGMSFINGVMGREPLRQPGPQTDILGGALGYIGTLIALSHRTRTGESQHVDASSLDAVLTVLLPQITQHSYQGVSLQRRRPGNDAIFACEDGYLGVYIAHQDVWEFMTGLLDVAGEAADPQIATQPPRLQNIDLVRQVFEPVTKTYKKADLQAILAAARANAGMVLSIPELRQDPHLQARRFFTTVADGRSGEVAYPGPPFRLEACQWGIRRPAPRLGEHNDEVMATILSPSPEGSTALSQNNDGKGDGLSASGNENPITGRDAPVPTGLRGHQSTHRRLALDHLRIVDLTQAWAGPLATQFLADHGAEVIKIEARQRLDIWRASALAAPKDLPAERHYNRTYYINCVNRNKYGLTLDLGREKGRDLFRKLVRTADVVAENFTPRVMKNFGLDFAALHKLRPGLIMISLPAYGGYGPYSNYPGVGSTIEPMSGNTDLLGYGDGPPLLSGTMYSDPVGGFNGAAAILTALHYRERTGKGQHIDLSQQESMMNMIGHYFLVHSLSGEAPTRQANQDPILVPHRNYRCRGEDQWVAIVARDDADWAKLCRVMGAPDLAGDPRFATMTARVAKRRNVDNSVEEWTRQRSAEEVEQALLAAGVPVGKVRSMAEIDACPHLNGKEFFVAPEHPEVGIRRTAGLAPRLTSTPGSVRRAAPCLGQHSAEVLRELLGLSDTEIAGLIAEEITGDEPIPAALSSFRV